MSQASQAEQPQQQQVEGENSTCSTNHNLPEQAANSSTRSSANDADDMASMAQIHSLAQSVATSLACVVFSSNPTDRITWLKDLGVQDEDSLKELLQKTIFRHFANDPSEVPNCLTE